jgi:hypothetical protein
VNIVREGLRIKRKARELWAKAPFFSPPSRTGEGGRGGLGRRQAAAPQGDRFPYPPWAVMACRGGSAVAAERGGAGYGRWRWKGSGRRVRWSWRCVVQRGAARAIYSRSKAVRGRYFQRGGGGSPAKAVLQRGRGGRPESRSPVDGTAQAEAN